MENAQKEEFTHFGMDLEFLLRRKQHWRTILKSTIFSEGDNCGKGRGGREAFGLRVSGCRSSSRYYLGFAEPRSPTFAALFT